MVNATDRKLWTAALNRDGAFDDVFVYAVRTTGVFCRPTCPSRRPHLRNVRLFPSAKKAALEGFRPCLRCRPELRRRPGSAASLAIRACDFLRRHCDERITLGAVARSLGVSPHHLQRRFTAVLGISPREYLGSLRLERFRSGAKASSTVSSALYQAGFGSPSRLYERAGMHLGMSPGRYQKGGQGMEIDYTVISSRLGRVLVAATPLGICAVEMGHSDRMLVKALIHRYPRSRIRRNRALLRGAAREVLGLISGETGTRELPLDVRATAFQARVWSALRSIPTGKTATYGEIARGIGRPGSARAVGRAIASNPVALIIPCHRAVASGGRLSGYHWGPRRKRRILELERTRNPRSSVRRKGETHRREGASGAGVPWTR